MSSYSIISWVSGCFDRLIAPIRYKLSADPQFAANFWLDSTTPEERQFIATAMSTYPHLIHKSYSGYFKISNEHIHIALPHPIRGKPVCPDAYPLTYGYAEADLIQLSRLSTDKQVLHDLAVSLYDKSKYLITAINHCPQFRMFMPADERVRGTKSCVLGKCELTENQAAAFARYRLVYSLGDSDGNQ